MGVRLLVAVLVALVASPVAEAAKLRFRVTVEGHAEVAWQHQSSYMSHGCQVTEDGAASQRLEFRSRLPKLITARVAKGRIRFLEGTLGTLAGSLTGGGSTTFTSCNQRTVADCDLGPQAFTGATARLARPGSGVLRLSGFAADDLHWCAPPAALAPPEYPPLAFALGRVNEKRLLKRRTTVVTAEDERVTHLAAQGETGQFIRQIGWELTFLRLSR